MKNKVKKKLISENKNNNKKKRHFPFSTFLLPDCRKRSQFVRVKQIKVKNQGPYSRKSLVNQTHIHL